ncbi:MAG: hypothetical protein ACE5KK_00615, partial [Candidatus Brocadiales bacterium]
DCDRMCHQSVIKRYSECEQQKKVTKELLDTLTYLTDMRKEAKFPNRVANVDDRMASHSMDVIRRKRAALEREINKSRGNSLPPIANDRIQYIYPHKNAL